MKYFKNVILALVIMFMCTLGVDAASGSITASSSTKNAVVGSTFTVTVKVSCSEAIGSWQFGVSYDSAYISLVSGDTSVAGYGDGSTKSKSYTYKFKAIKSGTAGVRISTPLMVSWNDDATMFTPSSSGVQVKVKTQAEIEASYSKDNTLKSLSVEGYELSPEFKKDVTSYTVMVPDTVTEIKVNATKNDGNASVRGAGTINISEGTNKVEVVVTAQNGAIKTYTITVDVKDLNPINVKVDEGDYTVVKKAELMESPIGFNATLVKIGEQEVPGFKSDVLDMTLVGLKGTDGTIGLFIYDEGSNTYSKYVELKGASLTLIPQKLTSVPKGFVKETIKINDSEHEVLKSTSVDNFYLVYAMNVETGKTGYYIYDSDEHGFVKYNSEAFESINDDIKEYKLYLIACGGVILIFLLITIILGNKNSKLKKIIKRSFQKEKEERAKLEEAKEKKEEEKSEAKSEDKNVDKKHKGKQK